VSVSGTVFGGFRILALAAALAITGCAGQQAHELIGASAATVPDSKIAGSHEIFVATTRARAKDTRQVFSGDRSDSTAFAKVDVTVPAQHKTGQIERPKRGVVDPGKFFTATSVSGYRDEEAFSKALRADITRRGGRALVFIHGYNTHFDDAVYRLTQIAHDAGYKGTPILFTWASAGRTVDYVYDNNSAHAARDALEETLRLITRSGAQRVDIVAHSMGNWVTMEALRQLAITSDRDLDGKLGDVVLASPDIDVDVFKSQMRRYGKPDKPFFVFVSANDRALNISGLIAGRRPRLGDYTDARDIASLGIVVADLSAIKVDDRLNHTKFADNPALVQMLGERLNADDSADPAGGEITRRVNSFAQGLGQTFASAAEIIVTTPVEVLKVAVGQ
jgi:esterase/lipase superfamily enzyme